MDEIRSSLEFYTAQAQGARIERVIVSGGGSKLDGFLDLLRQRIPVQIDAGQVFERVTHNLSLSEEALAEAEPLLAVAVGLAIPGRSDVSQVNLLPPEILERQPVAGRRPRWSLPACAVVLLLILVFYLLQNQRLSSVNDDDRDPGGRRTPNVQAQINDLQHYADPADRGAGAEALPGLGVAGRGLVLGDADGRLPRDPRRTWTLDGAQRIQTHAGRARHRHHHHGRHHVRGHDRRVGDGRCRAQTIATWLTRLEGVEGLGQPVGVRTRR